MDAWKHHVGGIAWPTLALAVACWVAALTLWSAVLSGAVPMALGTFGMVVVIYGTFTPIHEAMHGNIGGRRWPVLDTVVGWACCLLFLAPYPAFRAIHLRHHARVNRTGEDPDLYISGAHPAGVAWRCLTVIPHYYLLFTGPLGTETSKLRRIRAGAVASLLAYGLAFAGLTWRGHGLTVLALWIVPVWLGSALLVFVLDWVPHHPHTSTDRWTNTRVLPGRWLELWMLGQNYHLVHHLWPRVPFYRYRAVFEAERETLEAHGSPIGWSPDA